MTAPSPAVRLLVCGNPDRSDDGAALTAVAHVLARVEDEIRRRIEIRRCAVLDPTDLIDVPPERVCVVVDTVVGIEPGSTVVMPLAGLAAFGNAVAPRSSHALPIDQVVGIAGAIRGSVPEGTLVGIGGSRFAFGDRRSRAVTLGMDAFEQVIASELRRLTTGSPDGAPAGLPPPASWRGGRSAHRVQAAGPFVGGERPATIRS